MNDPTDFSGIIGQVARELLGKPTQESKRELRYGTHGSMSIDLEKDTFYDHENKEGGGVLDLIARKTGCANGEAVDWLKIQGLLPGDRRAPRYEGAISRAFRDAGHPIGHSANNDNLPPAEEQTTERRVVVATYIYTDENGTKNRRVTRFEPRNFAQAGWTGSGWRTGEGACAGLPVYPYRLPEMLAAGHLTVFIVEGEKDADRLASCGFVATTNPQGAGKWREEMNQWFSDRDCFILADNDEPGRKHAHTVAGHLKPIAHSVRVVELPGLPEKGDVSDWLDADPENRHRLVDVAKAVPIWNGEQSSKSAERHLRLIHPAAWAGLPVPPREMDR